MMSETEKQKDTENREVFRSPLAGMWYPADAGTLRAMIDGMIDEATPEPLPDEVAALILPHAGYRYSGKVAAWALAAVRRRQYERVVLLGPTHRAPMRNLASVPDCTHYETPLGEVALDVDAMAALKASPLFRSLPEAHAEEHSVQIEVPMLQAALGEFRLVPIVVGQLDRGAVREMASVVRPTLDGDTLVVVSSDFTHYGPRFGYVPFTENVTERLKELDMGACDTIKAGDPDAFLDYVDRTGATICGRHPIAVLLAMLPPDARARVVKHDTSGAMTGDTTHSVSYVSMAFTRTRPPREQDEGDAQSGLSETDKGALLRLARESIAFAFTHNRPAQPGELDAEPTPAMEQDMGAFVTIHMNGRLRGCIGEIEPRRPLYEAVTAQAFNAAFRDNRFPPLEQDGLPLVRIEISALTPPRPVGSPEDIVIGRHGIVMSRGAARAVFLPQVALQQGWNLEQTLTQLARKAGMPADAWKEGATFHVFEAIIFHEE